MFESRRLLLAKASALPLLLVILLNAGCEDPSNVGLGLIGESGGSPIRLQVPAEQVPIELQPPTTSNVRSSLGFTVGPTRILAGSAADPVFGTVITRAYLDVAPSASQSSDYRSGTITSVELELVPDYVYGDTMASTEFVVSEMDFDWPSTSLPADTTLTVGTEITRFEHTYRDTALVIELPESWYAARSGELLSDDIVADFDGFSISAVSPAAVIGFNATSAIFRIATTTGTAELVLSKIFTHVERLDDANIPDGRAVLQDGVGQLLSLDWDFEADSIAGAAVSRAVIALTIDKETLDGAPEHFVRPTPPQIDVVGVRDDGTSRLLRSALPTEDAIRFVSTAAAPGELTIVRTVQRASTGNSEFKEFRLGISEVQAAVNATLVFAPGADDNAPVAILTVTPNSF
jgi:hypothetical protein